MKINHIACAIAAFLLPGCTAFTEPSDRPVIEERLNSSLFTEADVGTLSLTPERRVVLVHFRNHKFCAEAPTETGLDTSSLLKIAAQAGKTDEASASIEAIKAITRSHSVLNKRTQGMQLFLANAYFICQMYMNDAITSKELVEIQLRTLNAIAPLIEKEVSLMYHPDAVDGNSEETKFIPLDINEVLQGSGSDDSQGDE